MILKLMNEVSLSHGLRDILRKAEDMKEMQVA